MTRWLDFLSIFGNLQLNKISQKHTNFGKVGSKFWPNIKETLRNNSKDFLNLLKWPHTAVGRYGR